MRDVKRSTAHVRMARRGTSREINRQIAVNLIRTRQPISRADLARLMGTTRGSVTVLVNDLIEAGLVFEGATGESPRGRKPKFLYLDARRIGVVVPGMVDRSGTRVLFAPRLGWRDVPLQEPLAAATGLPVVIENSGKACALALAWSARGDPGPPGGFVFVNVSDGLGVGVVTNGQLVRGQNNAGGEFGHIPLALDG